MFIYVVTIAQKNPLQEHCRQIREDLVQLSDVRVVAQAPACKSLSVMPITSAAHTDWMAAICLQELASDGCAGAVLHMVIWIT